jgi:hypothetical protein
MNSSQCELESIAPPRQSYLHMYCSSVSKLRLLLKGIILVLLLLWWLLAVGLLGSLSGVWLWCCLSGIWLRCCRIWLWCCRGGRVIWLHLLLWWWCRRWTRIRLLAIGGKGSLSWVWLTIVGEIGVRRTVIKCIAGIEKIAYRGHGAIGGRSRIVISVPVGISILLVPIPF